MPLERARRGFTLIELLVVIAIIGLLATIAVVTFGNTQLSARDARRAADMKQLMAVLNLYYSDNGQYPASGGATAPNISWSSSNDSSWDTLQTVLQSYVGTLPKDPTNSSSGWAGNSGKYVYSYFRFNGYGCPGQQYMLVYRPEDASKVALSPSFTTCDSTRFNYAGTITQGERAK